MVRNITNRRLRPRAIVFDMDGVLLHSSPIHDAAYREALHALPILDFCYSRVAGMRSLDGVRAILNRNHISLPEERIHALASEKSRIALAQIMAQNPIVPGAGDLLRNLTRRFLLALASSASAASVETFLDRNDLRGAFHCVVHSGDVRNAKPSPEIFTLAIGRLGIAPASSLVVEDAVSGIQASKAAGAPACGIPSTCCAEELVRAGADLMIDRLEDLLEIGASS